MIIGLTYDLKTDWVKRPDDPVDISAEFDGPETVALITRALEAGGHKVKQIGNVNRLLKLVDDLGVDIVFNICEGKGGRSRESQVPMILEMKGIPYVGTDALAQGITLDKVFAKKVFIADGIPTPRFFNATKSDDLSELNTIGFPLIVKTRHEGTSKGLTNKSKVKNIAGLVEQVAFVNDNYRQSALVEEFIKGTEFTVAVLGNKNPEAVAVIQISINGSTQLGENFFTYEYVVEKDVVNYVVPAPISKELTAKLKKLAIKAYNALECRDFGRVDFRVDEKGNPYVLEINPLPSLAHNDVFNIFPTTIGTTYEEIINRILNYALERNGLTKELTQKVGV